MALAQSSYDPLSEFASEAPGEAVSERLSISESNRAAVWPPLILPQVPSRASRAPGGRWVVGTVMLGVGLAAGFACAVAVVTLYGDPHTWLQMLDFGRTVSDTRSVEPQSGDDPTQTTQTIEIAAPPATPAPGARTERGAADARPMIPLGAVSVLYVQSRPRGAEVFLDDQLVTTTPFQLSDIPLGPHTIRIEMPGYRPWSESITVEVGSRIAIAAALEQ